MKKEKGRKPWIMRQAVISALRNVFRRSPLSSETLKAAKREAEPVMNKDGTVSKAKRVEYQCAHCKEWFAKKVKGKNFIFVDHITPVVDTEAGFTTWDEYLTRMYHLEVFNYDKDTFASVLADWFQVLCKTCHDVKTKTEGKKRTETKKKKRGQNESADTKRKSKA